MVRVVGLVKCALALSLLLVSSQSSAAFEMSSSLISSGTGRAGGSDFRLTLSVLGNPAGSGEMQTTGFNLQAGLVHSLYGEDADRDGYPAGQDNCIDIANPDQSNLDGDLLGDACDDDDDEDTFVDAVDNCPLIANLDQLDTDGDGQGDACDADIDNDGVENTQDVAPLDESRCQDQDADLCDDCSRGADAYDPTDNFFTDNDGLDTDSNGFCDLGDPDDDGDGWLDAADNCPLIGNPLQEDADNDGRGDLCESAADESLCFPIKTLRTIVLICL